MPHSAHHPIPNLFPDTLELICTNTILNNLTTSGKKVEKEAQWIFANENSFSNFRQAEDSNFCRTNYFEGCVNMARDFLVSFLASHLLNKLASTLATPNGDGETFCFSVVCNDRLSKLVVHRHEHTENADFWTSPFSNNLLIDCLHELRGLSSLTIQNICTNEILSAVAQTCSRLQVLDISYSTKVTDIGLVHLCGESPANWVGFDQFNTSQVRGCKYLRELYFYPKSTVDQHEVKIMPRVISYLLKHLTQLQVADLENLHEGIEYYYKGSADVGYRPRLVRVIPLKLRFYTGSDDKLSGIIPICPKLSNFKLFVTEALTELAGVLKNASNTLDRLSLVFGSQDLQQQSDVVLRTVQPLPGLSSFLQCCGNRINSLEIDFSSSLLTNLITIESFRTIAEHCPLLESLSFSKFRLDQPVETIPAVPVKLKFLTALRLNDMQVEDCGREFFMYVLGGCQDLEFLSMSFKTTTLYFNDFLLDDILIVNSFGRLQQFILSKVSLTLISALRMISNRPKLMSIGHLLDWDVEECELEAFAQILRRAKSLNLLQDISIV